MGVKDDVGRFDVSSWKDRVCFSETGKVEGEIKFWR